MDISDLNIEKKDKKIKDKKKVFAIVILIIGIITLIGGLVFLLLNIFAEPGVRDAEYVVAVGEWTLDGSECIQLKCGDESKCMNENGSPEIRCEDSGVIWNFTEIGKGTLTTNNHENDYDFIWAMEDGELKIETDWLYKLEDEYEYKLDQNSNTLTLIGDDESWVFVPATLENE